MADAVQSAARHHRHAIARSRLRKDDVWIAATALVGALLALPLAQSTWHGPEVASVLAVGATALLARMRWAIAIVVVAELLLAPTLAARGFTSGLDLWPGRIAALVAMMATVPGLLAARRGAAALVLVSGMPRTRAKCRRFHLGLVAVAGLGVVLPLAF